MDDTGSRSDADELVALTGFLRALARRLVGDGGADDLVQETCVVALTSGGARRGGLRAWLAGVLRNRARMAARAGVRRRALEPHAATPPPPPDPSEVAERLETQARLLLAVRALPEPTRRILVARFQEGLNSEEIAAREGIPASTVRNHVQRGLARLREQLDGESPEGRRGWTRSLLPLALGSGSGTGSPGGGSRGPDGRGPGGRGPAGRPPGAPPALGAALKGGAMVLTGKKLLVAAAVLLLLALGGAVGLGVFTADRPPEAPPPDRRGSVAPRQELPRTAPVERPAEPGGAAEAIPGPYDLGHADRDRDLFGLVKDPAGRPVAGASVETLRYPWRRSQVLDVEHRDEVEAGPSCRSATDGSFLLTLPRGTLASLRVTAARFADAIVPECQAGERVDVTMRPGAALAVLARDEAGSPVPGVSLHLWRNPSGNAEVLERDGVTGPNGRFEFRGLTAGRCYLRCSHPVLGSPYWKTPSIPAEGTESLEIVLSAGRTIRGRVTDAATGAPIAGARVGENWVVEGAVPTDADGRYAFPGWTGEGVRDLHVIAEGYGRLGKVVPPEGDVDFALARGDEAAGRIVGAGGEPVAGALLTALAHTEGGLWTSELDVRSTRSGPDGAFLLTSLRRDVGPHTLVVQAAGHGKLLLDFPPHDGGAGRIDLGDVRLPASRAIEGRVLDAAGEPVAAVPVEIRRTEARAIPDHYGGREARRTDDLGRFRFPDLAPGQYAILVEPPGEPGVRQDLELPEDRDVLDAVVRLAGGGTLALRVLDPDGRPAAGVTVFAPGASASVRTGADGRATLSGLPDRPVTVGIYPLEDPLRSRVLPAEPVQATPAGQEVVVRLREAAAVEGVALDPDGQPLARVRVSVVDAGGRSVPRLAVTTGEDGRFHLRLPPGETFELEVDGQQVNPPGVPGPAERLPVEGRLAGVAGPREGLVLRTAAVAMDRTLTVLVLDLEGRPLPGAVVALDVRGRYERPETGADGRVTLERLPASDVALWVFAGHAAGLLESAVNPKAETIVPAGQVVTMRFRQGTLLEGVVLDPDGNPAERAHLSVMTDEGVSQDVATDAAGRFRCPALPGAAHRVWVEWQGSGGRRATAMREGVRPEDGETEIRLEAAR